MNGFKGSVFGFCAALLVLGAVGCSDDECPTCPEVPVQALAQIDFDRRGGSSVVTDSAGVVIDVGTISVDAQAIVDLWFTAADSGRTIRIDASNNPEFAGAIEILTNGGDDRMQLHLFLDPPVGSGTWGYESDWIDGGTTGDLHPDLAGTEISHVLLHLLDVEFESPGMDPNQDGVWTDYDIDMRLVIMGRP